MQAAKNDSDNMPARIHVEGKFNNNKLYKGNFFSSNLQ